MSFTRILILSLNISTAIYALDSEKDPWVAKDPWKGHVYTKENVPLIAKAISATTTIASAAVVATYAGSYLYNNFEFNTTSVGGYPINYPASESLLTVGGAILAVPTVFKWSLMIPAYAGKKLGILVNNSWKFVKYGWDKAMYLEHHIRAQHFQGTLFSVNDVNYIYQNQPAQNVAPGEKGDSQTSPVRRRNIR